jgi:hypothetical protein
MTTWIVSSLLFGYDIVILFRVRTNFVGVLLARFYTLSELLSIKNNIFSTKNLIQANSKQTVRTKDTKIPTLPSKNKAKKALFWYAELDLTDRTHLRVQYTETQQNEHPVS